MDYLKFDYKLFVFLTVSFILMTVIGTLTHELGHYTVARLVGYEASINYQSSSHWKDEPDADDTFCSETYRQCSYEIKNGLDFPNKEKYDALVTKYREKHFWIRLGGPIQTIVTGTIGLLLLIVYRKKYILSDKVQIMGWVLIFLSLFWLRQVANLFAATTSYIIKGQPSYRCDEMQLALYLDINVWSIEVITGIIGFGILLFILRLLPKTLIITFVISGLLGGVSGYYLWLIKFGKMIMP